jgi:hypothetical protein
MPSCLAEPPVPVAAFQLQTAVRFLLGEPEPLHEDRLGALDSRSGGDHLAPPGKLRAELPQVASASDGDLRGRNKCLCRDWLDQMDQRADAAREFE